MNIVNAYDFFGNVALVKFPRDANRKEKMKFADNLMRKNKSIKTVLEKSGKFKGRLRKQETKYLAGEKTKEVLYRENSCVFRFNIDKTYFSPRLSNERKEIAEKIKKGDEVLVMFAGVGPFSIVIAKNSKARKVYSNEINKEANKYAQLNIELNKVKDKVVLIPGDVKRIAGKLSRRQTPSTHPHKVVNYKSVLDLTFNKNLASYDKRANIPSKFDVIVMPRPKFKESFLKEAFSLSRKGTRIFYYDFTLISEKNLILEKIRDEAKKARKKIKILKIKNAGEIAPYKIRVRVDLRVLN